MYSAVDRILSPRRMKSVLVVLATALLVSIQDSTAFAANGPQSRSAGKSSSTAQTRLGSRSRCRSRASCPTRRTRARLVMFYSGVPVTNRNVCFIGKAWALKSDPFTWHQDEHNPVFGPGKQGWDSGSIRLDAVLYLAGGGCLLHILFRHHRLGSGPHRAGHLPRRGRRIFRHHARGHPARRHAASALARAGRALFRADGLAGGGVA